MSRGERADHWTVKPSTLIAGAEGSSGELKAAAEILDDNLEKLWDYVAE